jgi:hypothetical protein
MSNDKRNKKETFIKPQYQDALFGLAARWEKYCAIKRHFRNGSPKEIFFKPKDSGQIKIVGTTIGDDCTRIGERDSVYDGGDNGKPQGD